MNEKEIRAAGQVLLVNADLCALYEARGVSRDSMKEIFRRAERAPSDEFLKGIVQFVARHMERESALLYPAGMRNVLMNDPYGLLKLIEQEAKLTPQQIDAWMVEAQGKKT